MLVPSNVQTKNGNFCYITDTWFRQPSKNFWNWKAAYVIKYSPAEGWMVVNTSNTFRTWRWLYITKICCNAFWASLILRSFKLWKFLLIKLVLKHSDAFCKYCETTCFSAVRPKDRQIIFTSISQVFFWSLIKNIAPFMYTIKDVDQFKYCILYKFWAIKVAAQNAVLQNI